MAGIWPDDVQCVALITFDVDGITSWLNRNPDFANYPSLLSMAEYGPSVATPRILDLLDAQGVPSSFYVPGMVAETHPDLVREIAGRGHEVAHHGYIHEPPATLTPAREEEVLIKGIGILGDLTGAAPVGYRSPSWELSPVSLDLLAKHDFRYDSSLMGDDAPYFVARAATRPAVWWNCPFTGCWTTRPTSPTRPPPTGSAPCATPTRCLTAGPPSSAASTATGAAST